MKVLHVASFIGNIGDNASHLGLKHILSQLLPDHKIEQIEIREFYQNYKHRDRKKFDDSFIDHANNYDLLIMGGGGFLDYWVKGSVSGTTIDMNPALLNRLKTPTLFTSIGCNPSRSVPEGNIDKFKRYLNVMLDRKNIRLAVRNDGSVDSIKKDIGDEYLENIREVLDNGYFYSNDCETALFEGKKYITVNIAKDQIAMSPSMNGCYRVENYYKQLATVLQKLISDGYEIVLVPHIFSDLSALSCLLNEMNDYIIRKNVSIAPCVQGNTGADALFSIYKNSVLVLGMRFHANVCNISLRKPTLGLVVLNRVKYTYDFMSMEGQYVHIDRDFHDILYIKINNLLTNMKSVLEKNNQSLQMQRRKTLSLYQEMLNDIGLQF